MQDEEGKTRMHHVCRSGYKTGNAKVIELLVSRGGAKSLMVQDFSAQFRLLTGSTHG